jgi:voltage-gated sodium channel
MIINQINKIVNSKLFRNFITSIIILSGVIIAIETYPEIHRQHYTLLHWADRLILYIFAVEISLKMISYGRRPWDYFKDPWNVFDFLVVAVCFLPLADTHYVAVLRIARILRVLRVFSVMPRLQLLVSALLKSIPSMGYVIFLLGILFFIYGVLGTFIFGQNDPVHFGNLHLSVITLFKVLTLEGWTDILNFQLYGTSDPSAEFNSQPHSYGAFFYFVSFILIGAMIIMNLFIGVIMNSMQESHKELEDSLKGNSRKKADVSQLLYDIDKKMDELKSDLSRIKNLV